MRTRITVVFDGAKFNYEASISKESILTELNNIAHGFKIGGVT